MYNYVRKHENFTPPQKKEFNFQALKCNRSPKNGLIVKNGKTSDFKAK